MATFKNSVKGVTITRLEDCNSLLPSPPVVLTVSLFLLSLVSSATSLGEFCSMFGAECRYQCGPSGAVQVTYELCEQPLRCCFKSDDQQTNNRGLPTRDLRGGQLPFYKQRYQHHQYPKPFQPAPPTSQPSSSSNYIVPPPSVCGVRAHSRVRRIVNGAPTRRCQYPWMVLLDRGPNPWDTCGASLISDRHIITAAHCFEFVQTPVVVLGEYDKNEIRPGSEIRITDFNITRHPLFDNVQYVNDIAIITLATPIDLSIYECLRPICLPDENEDLPVGTNCHVIGWGSVQRVNEVGLVPRTANVLQETTIQVVRPSLCDRVWGVRYHRDIQICAGDMSGQTDSCLGDSGGPLMCVTGRNQDVYQLHGVVSLGSTTCAAYNVPALYTDVRKFRSWIEDMMKK